MSWANIEIPLQTVSRLYHMCQANPQNQSIPIVGVATGHQRGANTRMIMIRNQRILAGQVIKLEQIEGS